MASELCRHIVAGVVHIETLRNSLFVQGSSQSVPARAEGESGNGTMTETAASRVEEKLRQFQLDMAADNCT